MIVHVCINEFKAAISNYKRTPADTQQEISTLRTSVKLSSK
jgi:hypothetical protein